MLFRIDPNQYTTIPTRTPAATLSLYRALVAAAGEQPVPAVSNRLAKMHGKATTLQKAWIDANRPDDSENVRTYDIALDRRWGALRNRVAPWAESEDEEFGERAEQLIELLFPTGLDFLNLPYAEQWAQSERRLQLIVDDGLEADINELAGERFLKRLREAHLAYGEVLGITKKKDVDVDSTSVLDSLRSLRSAIAGYARLVLGLVEDDDPKSIAEAEAALEPILRFRKSRSVAEEAEAEEPIDAPLPNVPVSEGE